MRHAGNVVTAVLGDYHLQPTRTNKKSPNVTMKKDLISTYWYSAMMTNTMIKMHS